MIFPAFLHLKVAPFQTLHFSSKLHTADKHGLIRGVPYDTAKIMIDDPNHPAKEATKAELADTDVGAPVIVPVETPVAAVVTPVVAADVVAKADTAPVE